MIVGSLRQLRTQNDHDHGRAAGQWAPQRRIRPGQPRWASAAAISAATRQRWLVMSGQL